MFLLCSHSQQQQWVAMWAGEWEEEDVDSLCMSFAQYLHKNLVNTYYMQMTSPMNILRWGISDNFAMGLGNRMMEDSQRNAVI